ncbi:MAG: Uma2 family endonuclease [Bryobacteraceae bacterium]
MSPKVLLSAAELERLPDDDSVQIELDEGEVITMAPAGEDHGFIELKLATKMFVFVEAHDLGRVYAGDTGFRLTDDTVRSPDVAFVRKSRVAELRSKGFANGAPDLAVEIVSPSDSFRQMTRKVRQYFAAGCHTVWVIHPDRKEVEVFEATGSDRTLTASETLEAQDLLPGFSLLVGALFAA